MSSALTDAPANSPVSEEAAQVAIRDQIEETSRRLKAFDLVASLLIWAASMMGLMLLITMVDHWVAGLGTLARVSAFSGLVMVTGYFLVTQWIPLLLRRINPIYAAKSIEDAAPQMKNSLVNYLFLRERPADSKQVVLDAIAARAAGDLQTSEAELVVDASHMIRAGCVVAAMLAVLCLYGVLSPKSSISTAQRVLLPWADVARPTRVLISEVAPGDVSVLRGQHVDVTCKARGLAADELPVIHYRSLDGAIADQRFEMTREADRWTAEFPPSGATRHLQYYIAVGDGRSPEYMLKLLSIPTVVVEQVDYQPPTYTQLPPRTEASGEINAVEWTNVVVHAAASDDVETARLFRHRSDGSGMDPLAMQKTSDRALTASWTLKLSQGKQIYDSYHVSYTTTGGHESSAPIVHAIEVAPDLPPIVELLEPESADVDLPRNGTLRIVVRALDPDFRVRRLQLLGRVGAEEVLEMKREYDDAAPGRGQSVEAFVLRPPALGLRVGDELIIWGQAADNYGEGLGIPPHVTRSRSVRIRIGEPSQEAIRDESEQGGNEQGGNEKGGNETGGNETGGNETGGNEKGGNETGGNETGGNEKGGNEKGGNEKGGNEKGGNEKGGNETGGNEADGNEAGGNEQGGNETGGNETGGNETGGNETGGNETGGNEQGGNEQGGNEQGGNEQGGNETGGNETGGNETGGNETGGDETNSRGQGGSEAGGRGGAANSGRDPVGGASQAKSGAGGSATGDSADGNETSADAAGPNEQGNAGGDANSKEGGETRGGGNAESAGVRGSGEPEGPSEPLHDGEVIERLAEQLKQRMEQLRDQGADGKDATTKDPGDDQIAPNSQAKPGSERSAEGTGPEDSPPGAKPEGDMDTRDASKTEAGTEAGAPSDGTKSGSRGDRKEPESTGDAATGQVGEGATPSGKPANSDASPGRTKQVDAKKSGSTQAGEGGGMNESDGSKAPAEGAEPSEQSSDTQGGGETRPPSGKAQDDGVPATVDRGPGDSGDPGSPASDGSASGTGPRKPGQPSGSPAGGGVAGEVPGAGEGEFVPPTPQDKANLDYARKATELVLEHLEDQTLSPDPEMLEQMGWTEQDLRNFVTRWRTMKEAAGRSPTAARRWDDALRGLGLQAPKNAGRVEATPADSQQRLDAGAGRTPPPSRYRDKFKAFRQRSR